MELNIFGFLQYYYDDWPLSELAKVFVKLDKDEQEMFEGMYPDAFEKITAIIKETQEKLDLDEVRKEEHEENWRSLRVNGR